MKTKDVDICTVDGQRELTIFFCNYSEPCKSVTN